MPGGNLSGVAMTLLVRADETYDFKCGPGISNEVVVKVLREVARQIEAGEHIDWTSTPRPI
jgi:hypothetical protein